MATFQEKLQKRVKILYILLYIVGLLPNAPSKYRSILVILLSVYMFWLTLYSILVGWPNLQDVAVNMAPLLAALLVSAKVGNCVIRREKFDTLLKTIEADFWLANKDSPNSEKEIILQHAQLVYICHTFQAFTILSAPPMWLIMPVAEMYLLSNKEQFSKILPFKAWLPFETDMYSNPMYSIQYSIQGLTLGVTIMGLGAMDCIFVHLVIHTCAQFKLLQERIRNFNKNTDGVEVNLERQTLNINECIQQHQNLLNFCADLENNLNEVLFLQLFINCTVLCMACVIGTFPGTTLTFIQSGLAVCASLLESFLHCYSSSRLSTESLNVAEAAYDSEWYSASQNIKKKILFIIMRAQKPIYLTAGKFVPMSVETFEKITRTALSYFTVLTSMKEDNY